MQTFQVNLQKSRIRTAVSLLAGLLLAILILTGSAEAQTKSFYWERFDVEITLLENGDMVIEETQVLNFSGEPFTFGYGTILTGSVGNNDDIFDIQLREGDLVYQESSSNTPGTFEVSKSRDEVRIDWYFEPAVGQQTYTFSYVVQGGVIVGTPDEGSGDQIFWKAIPSDHPGRIQNSTVTIRLPEGVEPQRYLDDGTYLIEGLAAGDSNLVETRASEDGRIITYTLLEPLLPGQAFEVRVQFPHGILDIPTPDWQARQQNADVYGLIGIVISVLILVGGPLGVLALWYVRGRDPETGLIVPDYLPEPPSNLRPAVVGTLVDEKADMRDIISTLVDLAQRGYLSISENKAKNHVFTLVDESKGGLRPYETQFLKSFFGRKKERKLSELRYKFASKLPRLRKMLYEELIAEGLVDRSPDKVRNRYGLWAGLMVFIGMIAFFIPVIALPEDAAFVGCCASIALGITALFVGVVGRHMPTKTAKGAEEKTKWDAFKKYLQNIEEYEELAQAGDLFEKYLPYATAFGLDRSWIRKFSAAPYTPVPRWYYPYGYGRSIYHGSGGTGGNSGGGSTTPSLPTLDSAADGMAGGLESMSAGLTRMLNSTASTMRSVRSTSSTGGRSSGSFSGGFSGGSSGGGGNRGFG
ncbi:DUF2207 family protein [Candidatus Leptofilum sp.]|uniref:DUF2207 family protein n=1 Tax=Candidatus Leptofilum sp. TaxID=3241576 RepID=UPI003B5BB8BE